jgi:hypothetical protein
VAGPHCSSWIKPDALKEENERMLRRGLEIFESVANFGSKKSIEESRRMLVTQLSSTFELYHSLNEGRNPLAGLET